MLKLINHIKSSDGQGIAEYFLILALISVAVIAALTQWGRSFNDTAQEVNNALNTVSITTTT